MKILLVEDEVHKRDEILTSVNDVVGVQPEIVDSVNGAVIKIKKNSYDLIILDMALPTFGENTSDNKKGHDQAQGGVEVLRALKAADKSTKILIITQYPDFYISGKKVKLKDSAKIILDRYNQKVIGSILYTYKSKSTIQKIKTCLRASYENNDN